MAFTLCTLKLCSGVIDPIPVLIIPPIPDLLEIFCAESGGVLVVSVAKVLVRDVSDVPPLEGLFKDGEH